MEPRAKLILLGLCSYSCAPKNCSAFDKVRITSICLSFPSLFPSSFRLSLLSFHLYSKITCLLIKKYLCMVCFDVEEITCGKRTCSIANRDQNQTKSRWKFGISLHNTKLPMTGLMPIHLFLDSSLLKMIITYKKHETCWPKIGFRRWLF